MVNFMHGCPFGLIRFLSHAVVHPVMRVFQLLLRLVNLLDSAFDGFVSNFHFYQIFLVFQVLAFLLERLFPLNRKVFL